MATAKMVQGVVRGVDRPALAGVFPTAAGNPVVVIDVGANVDCSARQLAQFAVMGDIYSRVILRRKNPKVGLLSIGEEEHKGNDADALRDDPAEVPAARFCRQRGGRDIYGGATDVIVCDGFIGNVALR
jgi:glycerol-3-phosphate acyltransferase PlsX